MRFLVLLFCLNSIYCQNISCDFKDTIDISGGKIDNNKNYIFKNDVYKPGEFAEFNYKIVNFTTKIAVDPHIRGCVCKRKTCIRFCCQKNENCIKSNEISFSHDVKSTFFLNLEKTKLYGILYGQPCKSMYKLDPEEYEEDDAWILLKNGSIETGNQIYNIDSYCFRESSDSNKADAYVCFEDEDKDSRLAYYPVGMILSIPFLILTLTVYAAIPDLRNLHGKCLMCYVCGLIVFYICLIFVQTSSRTLEQDSCLTFGYVLYISLLFCFVWLNIMCYDIWFVSKHGLSRVFKSFEHNGFNLYAIYGFGSPILIGILVYLIDIYELLPTKFLPRIGYNRCWIQDSRIVEAIYVYVPMSILIIINITLFILTAHIIWKAQNIARDDDDNNLLKENVLRSSLHSIRISSQISCDFYETVNITGGQRIGDNFVFNNDTYSIGYYGEFDYIFENYDEIVKVEPHIRGCVCHLKPCIRICCQNDPEAFSGGCMKSNQLEFDNGEIIDLNDENYGILIGKPCEFMFMLDEDEWSFRNGKFTNYIGFNPTSKYCFGQTKDFHKTIAFICWSNDSEDIHLLYSIAMTISVPFLFATIGIYGSIAKLRTLHGKCLICLCTVLLIFYVLRSITNLYFSVPHEVCIMLGYLIYLASILPLVWMNIMCIDIFLLTKYGIRTETKEKKLFKYYSIYGFGLPFLMTFTIISIDLFELVPQKYMPDVGFDRCWIQSEKWVEAIYLRIPMSTIFIINIILFILTSLKIFKAHRTIFNGNKVLISRFFIYLKLFIVTGISWSMDIFAWIYFEEHQTFFIIFDLLNCLLGVFIFLVCVLNSSTLKTLKKSFSRKYSKNSANVNDHTTNVSIDT